MLLCMRKVDTESGHKLQPKLVYVSRLRDIWTSTVDCKWKQLCSSTSPVDRVATGASAASLNVPKFHEKSDWFRLSHLAHQKQDIPEEAPYKIYFFEKVVVQLYIYIYILGPECQDP